jgi:hypothetical protein
MVEVGAGGPVKRFSRANGEAGQPQGQSDARQVSDSENSLSVYKSSVTQRGVSGRLFAQTALHGTCMGSAPARNRAAIWRKEGCMDDALASLKIGRANGEARAGMRVHPCGLGSAEAGRDGHMVSEATGERRLKWLQSDKRGP